MTTTTLRYVPDTIGILTPKGFCHNAPVTQVIVHPEGNHPKGSCIRTDMKAIEIITPFGSRWYGSLEAYIDGTLRMVVAVNDRDEVASKWEPVKL